MKVFHCIKLRRILSIFYYIKLCYIRGYSYIGIPIVVVGYYFVASLYLKMNYGMQNEIMMFIVFSLIIGSGLTIGHLDIKHKFADAEMSVQNKINPELQTILKSTRRNKHDRNRRANETRK